MQFTWKL